MCALPYAAPTCTGMELHVARARLTLPPADVLEAPSPPAGFSIEAPLPLPAVPRCQAVLSPVLSHEEPVDGQGSPVSGIAG